MISRALKIAVLFLLFVLVGGLSTYFIITLTIKSEDTVIVPDLVGKNVVHVLEYLTALGLNTKVKESEYSADIPLNHVIFQDPEPGAEIKKGRDVKIVISKGTQTLPVPNLKGLSIEQSRILIEENGLCQGVVSRTYSDASKKDEVIAQAPTPGSLIERGGCVDLLVSLGIRPQSYMMPALVGLPLDEAIPLIERSHLLLTTVNAVSDKDRPLNTVVGQEPLSGYRVFKEGAVHLEVNRNKNGRKTTFLTGTKGVNLFRYRVASGFLNRRIRLQLDGFGISSDIIDEYVAPGQEIWLLIPKNMRADVRLYEDDRLVKTEVYEAW